MKSKKNRSERAEETTVTKDTTNVATTEVPKKKKKKLGEKGDKELATKNVEKAAKDEATERHTKYIYPAEVKTIKDKKDFRRKARAKIAEFTKKLNKLKKSTEEADKKELTKTEKEFNTWKAEHLNPAE